MIALNMLCLSEENAVDEEAALLCRQLNIHREGILRPRVDRLSFPDEFLTERYNFSS